MIDASDCPECEGSGCSFGFSPDTCPSLIDPADQTTADPVIPPDAVAALLGEGLNQPTIDDCPRHLCGNCGRFIRRTTVTHGGGYEGYDFWASGNCAKCGQVDAICTPLTDKGDSA